MRQACHCHGETQAMTRLLLRIHLLLMMTITTMTIENPYVMIVFQWHVNVVPQSMFEAISYQDGLMVACYSRSRMLKILADSKPFADIHGGE